LKEGSGKGTEKYVVLFDDICLLATPKKLKNKHGRKPFQLSAVINLNSTLVENRTGKGFKRNSSPSPSPPLILFLFYRE